MLKASIVLWLLASIYGLEIADIVKRDVKVPPETLKKIQKDVKQKVNYLLLDSVIDWRDTHVIFSIMHHNASLVFQKKLTQELDDVRLAVQTARENGRDASYCIEDTEKALLALKPVAELKFSECQAAGWKDFTDNYDVITNIMQTGHRIIVEMIRMKRVIALRPISESCVDGAE
ncbi:hypothetical protein KM043_018783 [Ampulex compressa]|nr:hypothetical protein KM043_018783 [Ampulex compressa]